uniref:T9SS type A sorting domain-containing protein n=1 Tax=Polaribacter sp. TaxID=1920175 RepID=UPI00404772A3
TSSIVTVSTVNTAIVGVYSVSYNVTDANGNGAIEVTRIVTVEDALSVVEIEKIELDIFPNPTSNIWQIKSSKMIESFDLFDITGKRLIYKKILSNDIQIDATSLPDGVYLILINKNKLVRLIKH